MGLPKVRGTCTRVTSLALLTARKDLHLPHLRRCAPVRHPHPPSSTATDSNSGLGVHISFVRSVSMDAFKNEEIVRMEKGGNRKCQEFFAAQPEFREDMSVSERYSADFAEDYKEKAHPPPPLRALANPRTSSPPTSKESLGSKNPARPKSAPPPPSPPPPSPPPPPASKNKTNPTSRVSAPPTPAAPTGSPPHKAANSLASAPRPPTPPPPKAALTSTTSPATQWARSPKAGGSLQARR